MNTVWLAGASGLVGSQLLPLLLQEGSYETVVSLGRKPLALEHAKLVQRTVDFAALDVAGLPSPTIAFCTLGTTIANAGSQAAFRGVDHDAVLNFAKSAREAGATTFVLVSSLGADPESSVFYSRVKGETERDLAALGFSSLAIAQPSLLLGDRIESRPAERVAIVLSRFCKPLLKPFAARPIEAAVVARALLELARGSARGVVTYPSSRLHALGGSA